MLVFAHLPKTGGTSITAVIVEFFKQSKVADSQIIRYGVDVPYLDLSPLKNLPGLVRFISGHLNPTHYKKIMPCRPFVLASSRNLRERMKSWFEHVDRIPKGIANVSSSLIPTQEFLEECKLAGTSCSLMNRAMEKYKQLGGFSTQLAQNKQIHRNQNVANAHIAINQIEDLVERLAFEHSQPSRLFHQLRNYSRENIHPAKYFTELDDGQEEVFDTCFNSCFRKELLEENKFCKNIPSVFEKEVWKAFSKTLIAEKNSGFAKYFYRKGA